MKNRVFKKKVLPYYAIVWEFEITKKGNLYHLYDLQNRCDYNTMTFNELKRHLLFIIPEEGYDLNKIVKGNWKYI